MDFGVGYAPFVYLKKFPVRKIKIDISFIRDISKNLNVMAIIEKEAEKEPAPIPTLGARPEAA